jgi:DNA-binding beta-propeller fold protein YncE
MRRLALMSVLVASTLALAAVGAVAGKGSGQERLHTKGTVWAVERFDGNQNTLAAFDAGTGKVLGVVPIGRRPIGVIAPRHTGKVYTADERSDQLSVLSKADFKIVNTISTGTASFPHHMTASPNGKLLYFGRYNTNTVGVVDTASDEMVATWAASANPLAKTHAVWITRTGRDLYATNEVANSVSKLDARTGELLWEFPIGNRPSEVLVTPDGETAYVTVRNDNRVKVLDVSREIPALVSDTFIGVQPDTMQLTKNGRTLVVGLRSIPSQMALMDTRSLRVRVVGFAGFGISGHQWLSGNDRYTFIALESIDLTKPGAIGVVENRSGEIVETWQYPGGPWPHGVFYERQVLR